MNTKTLLFLALAFFTTSALSAEMAKIIRMSGTQDVVVTMPDGSSVAGVAGLEMPVDSLIEVKAGTRLFFKTFEGQITVVEADSVIFLETIEVTSAGKEKTVVELKSGNLVANLDPTKRGTNDYGVRTPKGVAAARGTNYTVSVNGQNVVVTVVAGVVSINIPDVGPVALNAGSATTGGAATTIADALNSTDAATAAITRTALQAAAAVVATLAADPTSGVTTATLSAVVGTASQAASDSGDNGLVALVAATATQANPAAAATIVTAAVTAAPAAATNIVASVTQEVVDSGSADAATTAAALSTTASAVDGVTVNADTVTNAVTAPATTTTTDATGNTTETTETEPAVVIEVPTDNIVVSPSS